MKKKQAGVTLIEIMLVIAIAAMLIFFSIRQYQIFKLDNDVRALQVNVDQLFEGMGRFYQAECYGRTRSNVSSFPTTYGRLNPRVSSVTTFPIAPVTDLETPGYINGADFPLSPLVDTTGDADDEPFNGYVLQFNRISEVKQACTSVCNASQVVTGLNSAGNCCATRNVGTIVTWIPQVAVLLKNPDTALAYLRLLGADCLSSMSGANVTPCTGTGPGSGNYVVWERQVSFGSQDAATDSMLLNPTVKQFTNMYRVEPMTSVTGKSHSPEFQYYVCGSYCGRA